MSPGSSQTHCSASWWRRATRTPWRHSSVPLGECIVDRVVGGRVLLYLLLTRANSTQDPAVHPHLNNSLVHAHACWHIGHTRCPTAPLSLLATLLPCPSLPRRHATTTAATTPCQRHVHSSSQDGQAGLSGRGQAPTPSHPTLLLDEHGILASQHNLLHDGRMALHQGLLSGWC
jgi:hypothetical protein